jgi:hypothetical protein
MLTLPFQLIFAQNLGYRPFHDLSMIPFNFNLTGAVDTRIALPDLDLSCFAPSRAFEGCSMITSSVGAHCFFGLPLGLLF